MSGWSNTTLSWYLCSRRNEPDVGPAPWPCSHNVWHFVNSPSIFRHDASECKISKRKAKLVTNRVSQQTSLI